MPLLSRSLIFLSFVLLLERSHGFALNTSPFNKRSLAAKRNLPMAAPPPLETTPRFLFTRPLPDSDHTSIRSNRFRHRLTAMLRRSVAVFCLLASLFFCGPPVEPAFAVSGGRMGGSFSRSSSSSTSRYNSRRIYYSPAPNYYHRPSTTAILLNGNTRITATDIVVIGGVSYLIYNFAKQERPKTSVMSLTACLSIPDSSGADSLVNRLNLLSNSVDTGTRRGVQDLVSNVALELLRAESSIVSAMSSSSLFSNDDLAQRAFQDISTTARSKLDMETIHKFGELDVRITTEEPTTSVATYAVITLTVSLASTITLPKISSRKDLTQALRSIASSAPVGDALLAGEVVWAPTGPNERLTMQDVYADYPELVPL